MYCYEAIKELNLKPKNWKELLTDEIQNPNAFDAKVLSDFDHVKNT